MSVIGGINEHLIQLIPVFNTVDPSGGTADTLTSVQSQVAATNTMVDTVNHGISVNTIGTYDSGVVAFNNPVQFLAGVNGDTTIGGNVVVDGNVTCTALFQTSDKRLKEDIAPIARPLSTLMGIRGVTYAWKNKEEGEKDVGFIAQELEKVYPVAVCKPVECDKGSEGSEGTDDYWRVSYIKVVPLLVEAVKQLEGRVRELESQMDVVYRYNHLSKG
jgi:hypothetical protein